MKAIHDGATIAAIVLKIVATAGTRDGRGPRFVGFCIFAKQTL
jgi:hypothetical protein